MKRTALRIPSWPAGFPPSAESKAGTYAGTARGVPNQYAPMAEKTPGALMRRA